MGKVIGIDLGTTNSCVAVMDGILMITYFNETHARGASNHEAMFHAASQRMRPMLMTALCFPECSAAVA